ncbi:MAG: SDR family oxidoreductase [Verrucomicrobia bacterium]|nr:SDR family oxidoreductase [Verrucomicrobiota bacterium]
MSIPILERFKLTDRTALVTGAGQGIGEALAHAVAQAGARVAVVDVNGANAEKVAAAIRSYNKEVVAIACDIRSEEEVARMVQEVTGRFGGLHVAFNNAGINRNSAAEETPLSEWDETFAVNLRGVFICCQEEGRVMLKAGYGKIINTASMSSIIVPHPQKQAAYNTSKAGVVNLTRSLAAEWADRGVRVNCISPGILRTKLIMESPALAPLVEGWIRDIPMGRLCELDDLTGAAIYLASEVSDYMTGHNLVIEGGTTLW